MPFNKVFFTENETEFRRFGVAGIRVPFSPTWRFDFETYFMRRLPRHYRSGVFPTHTLSRLLPEWASGIGGSELFTIRHAKLLISRGGTEN